MIDVATVVVEEGQNKVQETERFAHCAAAELFGASYTLFVCRPAWSHRAVLLHVFYSWVKYGFLVHSFRFLNVRVWSWSVGNFAVN